MTPLRRLNAALPHLVVFAAGVFLFYEADHFQFEQVSGRIGPGAWPQLIIVLMLATALWGIVSSAIRSAKPAREHDAAAEQEEELVRPPEIHPYRVWLAVGMTIAYLACLPLLGFFLATIIYSFSLMYLGQFRRPVSITFLSVAIALCFMFVFMRVVYVALPLGVAPFDRMSYALMAAMGVH